MTNLFELLAIITGPSIGILVGIIVYRITEKRSRKIEVLCNLVGTVDISTSTQHVAAINLIRLLFRDNKIVINKREEYVEFLFRPIPKDDQAYQIWYNDKENKFISMIEEMCKDLKMNIFDENKKERDRYKEFYIPDARGFEMYNQEILSEILEGKRPLFVKVVQSQSDNQTKYK